jgi:methyl-accepting chemotaxis protein
MFERLGLKRLGRLRFSPLSGLSIGQRIYLAFGTLVVLVAAVCIAGFLGLQSLASTFAQYQLATRQSAAITLIVQDFGGLADTVERYRFEPAPSTASTFALRLRVLSLNDPEVTEVLDSDPRIAPGLKSVRGVVASYGKSFDALTALNEEAAALFADMDEKAVGLITHLEAIADDPYIAFSGKGMELLLAARIEATKLVAAVKTYGANRIEEDHAAAKGQGVIAAASLEELKAALLREQPGVPESISALAGYLNQLDEAKVLVGRIDELMTAELERPGQRIQQGLVSLQSSILERQKLLGESAASGTFVTEVAVATGGAIAVVLALAMALGMSRWLSRTIGALASGMRRIAEGDLDTPIADRDQRNELGEIARALEVFRSNAVAVRALDAEQAESADAEAARLVRRTALQREVERVVNAARAGDFSGRIEEAGLDPELLPFAHSLNSVMADVDSGVGETNDLLKALAGADLSKRMTGRFEGAFAELRDNANTAMETFAEVVHRLQATSRTLKRTSQEILSGANDLSDRTSRQASTIVETSSAMDQLADNVRSNAEQAAAASQKTESASRMADEGGNAMTAATSAMERITASSARISNVIGLIDDIAFQTNLLALNASVEAARAGDAGRGFAVVALEVRRLAQSAAKASAEVKALIEESTNDVRTGARLVETAAGKLASILSAVREQAVLIGGITSATREQAAAIDEIGVAMRQLDEMTQHNAALVEETNASLEKNDEQASELDRIAALFQLSADADRDEREAAA